MEGMKLYLWPATGGIYTLIGVWEKGNHTLPVFGDSSTAGGIDGAAK